MPRIVGCIALCIALGTTACRAGGPPVAPAGSTSDSTGIPQLSAAESAPEAECSASAAAECGAQSAAVADLTRPVERPSEGGGLIRIASGDSLCMASDRYLGQRQDVVVTVDAAHYHGCCANCAARLARDPGARRARDPVSGREVDKGRAIIARDRASRLLYFESEETLAQYSAP